MKTTITELQNGDAVRVRRDAASPVETGTLFEVLDVDHRGNDRWDQPILKVRDARGTIKTFPVEWVVANLEYRSEPIQKREPTSCDVGEVMDCAV